MRARVGDIELCFESVGEGTPLVLTHGLGNDLTFWDQVVAPLAKSHRVLRWDVRGFGGSDKPAGPYHTTQLAADLAGLLDALGIDRVHLCGLSMGGVIAQRFALDHPKRLRSLILVSTSSEVGPRAVANWQRLADRVEERGFDDRSADATPSFSPEFAATHPELVRALGERVRGNDPRAYAAAARAVSDYSWTAELRRVEVPVLILQGLADRLTPPGGSVLMSRSLPSARLLMIPGAGHFLPLEEPVAFCAAVLAFTGAVDLLQPPPAARVGH
jgi:3-oxoadipate enol-lactonase